MEKFHKSFFFPNIFGCNLSFALLCTRSLLSIAFLNTNIFLPTPPNLSAAQPTWPSWQYKLFFLPKDFENLLTLFVPRLLSHLLNRNDNFFGHLQSFLQVRYTHFHVFTVVQMILKMQYARSGCFLEPAMNACDDTTQLLEKTLPKDGTYNHLCPEPWQSAHLGYTTTCTSLHEELWAILHHAMCKGGIQHRIPVYRLQIPTHPLGLGLSGRGRHAQIRKPCRLKPWLQIIKKSTLRFSLQLWRQ